MYRQPAMLALVLVLAGSALRRGRRRAGRPGPGPVAPRCRVPDRRGHRPASTPVEEPVPPLRIAAVDTTAPATDENVAQVLLEAYRSAAGPRPGVVPPPGEPARGHRPGRVRVAGRSAPRREAPVERVRTAARRERLRRDPDTDGGRWDRRRHVGPGGRPDAVHPRHLAPVRDRRRRGRRGGPQDIEDATATAAVFLCSDGRDLSDPAALRAAVLDYNHSEAYLQLVLLLQRRYEATGLDRTGEQQVTRLTSLPLVAGPVVGSTTQMLRQRPSALRTRAAGDTAAGRPPPTANRRSVPVGTVVEGRRPSLVRPPGSTCRPFRSSPPVPAPRRHRIRHRSRRTSRRAGPLTTPAAPPPTTPAAPPCRRPRRHPRRRPQPDPAAPPPTTPAAPPPTTPAAPPPTTPAAPPPTTRVATPHPAGRPRSRHRRSSPPPGRLPRPH